MNTSITVNRAKLIDLLWEGVKEKLYCSKEEYAESLKDWEVAPVELDGVIAFITSVKGPEVHFASCHTGKRMPPNRFKTFVQKVIDEHGYATTKTPKSDMRQHKFNAYFGFKPVGEDYLDIHYRIEKFRHA
jgi:hypothetical protein